MNSDKLLFMRMWGNFTHAHDKTNDDDFVVFGWTVDGNDSMTREYLHYLKRASGEPVCYVCSTHPNDSPCLLWAHVGHVLVRISVPKPTYCCAHANAPHSRHRGGGSLGQFVPLTPANLQWQTSQAGGLPFVQAVASPPDSRPQQVSKWREGWWVLNTASRPGGEQMCRIVVSLRITV